MIILVFLLFLLYIISLSKYYSHIGGGESTLIPFNVGTVTPLKGLLALMVMFSHTVPSVNLGVLKELGNYGAVAVGMFFFISGYGLLKSLLSKDDYLKHFLSKRFYKLLPPIIIVTLCFIPLRMLWQGESLVDLVSLLAQGSTLSPYAWYVYAIILYYLMFYIIFKVVKRKPYALVVMTLFIVAYDIAVIRLGWDAYWFLSSHCFPLGMAYCYCEDSIKKLYTGKIRLMIYVVAMSILCYSGIGSYLGWPAWGSLIYYLIPLLVMPLMYTLSFGKSPFLRFTGKISYEIYILHGVFIYIGNEIIPHDIFFVLFVITASYISSYGLHALCSSLYVSTKK